MTTAFVLGNGISRLSVSLDRLTQHGRIYGCNALYREFVPDVLVATDRPIAQAIQKSGYSQQHKFYTRKPLPNLGGINIPQPYYGYSSGPVATALAALDNHRTIYLLGFDLGPDQDDKFNNVYAGTEFYKPHNSTPTFTGNWIRQIIQITKNFSSTQFVRVHGPTTKEIQELADINNFVSVTMTDFLLKYH